MRALRIHAGPRALTRLREHGLRPGDVRVIPGAAGGPKGLVLGPLDRFVFGEWLADSTHPIDLVGASIGAWRLATACLDDPVAAFQRLENDYIAQDYELEPGRTRPTARHVSERFALNLDDFYGGRIAQVLRHPRYRLHIVTSRGRHLLSREQTVRTIAGYLAAYASNVVHRRALGAWLERVVFSVPDGEQPHAMPFDTGDLPTRQVVLTEANFALALRASCSIPFALQAVHDIPGAPRGAYWDGGITDYHLHLAYGAGEGGIVLYPHFQRAVVPGWLDKALRWRHRATHFLDDVVVLAPSPEWIAALPNGKLPDRTDFLRYGTDLQARMRDWGAAARASQQLADEFAQWLEKPDPARVEPL